MPSNRSAIFAVAEKYFKITQFRDGQLETISSILSFAATLAILPTGRGKSLCYQIPGLLLPGTTLVVSPLIALIHDQVSKLQQLGIAAAAVHSGQTPQEQQEVMRTWSSGSLQFLYVSPERLQQQAFASLAKQLAIALVVIDEAHCISVWGHDFRPEYMQLHSFIKSLPQQPKVAAFTATATKTVLSDIVESLKTGFVHTVALSCQRTNLHVHSVRCGTNLEKLVALYALLEQHKNQSGIIYTSTRKTADYLFETLTVFDFEKQLKIGVYHGGMSARERMQVQEKFITNSTKVIIATNAFGMGIDKANIRFVIHYQIPASIEHFSQEIGRAGRDGELAHCYHLLYAPDIAIQQRMIESATSQRLYKTVQLRKLRDLVTALSKPVCLHKSMAQYFGETATVDCIHRCSSCEAHELLPSARVQQRLSSVLQTATTVAAQQHVTPASIISPNLAKLVALINPQTESDWRLLPGVGEGFLQLWQPYFADALSEQKLKYTDET